MITVITSAGVVRVSRAPKITPLRVRTPRRPLGDVLHIR
jgi:hypothetical protein